MDSVNRLREVLNLFNNGHILEFSNNKDHRYGMDEDGHIGCIIHDGKDYTSQLLETDFSYNSWLDMSSKGYKELYDLDMFDVMDINLEGKIALAVTTNGQVNAKGEAIMGKGIALQFKNRFPQLPQILGGYLKQYGNRAFNLGPYKIKTDNGSKMITIISFPTKHSWKDNSDLTLISKSAEQVVEMCNKFKIDTCFLTPPGCGNGSLNYENTVKPVLELTLDERFYVCVN